MKKLFLLIFATAALISCGSSDSYKIKGTVDGVEDGTVMVLGSIEYNSLVALDSTVLKNGKFSFKGEADEAALAVVTFDMGESIGGCEFYLEGGNIDLYIDAVSGSQHIGGTVNNDAFQRFIDDTEALNDEAMEIDDKLRITLASQGDASDLYEQMNDLEQRFKAILCQSIKDNATTAFAYRQLMDYYSNLEPEETMDLLEALAPTFGQDMAFNQLTSMISAQLRTSLGQQFIDFETTVLDKKYGFSGKAKLSDYVAKNKIVLLDFWASWCTPCVNEIPYVKEAYNKFKSKGFEVVSVSVDDGTDEWIEAVKKHGMNWVQMWNGDEDIDNSAAIQYFVNAIPSTFLIDSDGTIIGRNLRGKELEEALEDYFKNN